MGNDLTFGGPAGDRPTDYKDELQFAALRRREVHLSGFVDVEMALQLIQEIALLIEKDCSAPITIRIASNGGSVDSEFAIIDAIHLAQNSGVKVIGEVFGHSMSAAFQVLQTCDVRRMGKNSVLMVHGITSWTVGDLRDLNAEQKLLHRLQHEAAKFLADRSTAPPDSKYKTKEFWMDIYEANTPVYLSPAEALEWGVVDEIV